MTSAERIASAVERSKREIVEDILVGQIPASVGSFSELHDHVDANEYGGLTTDNADLDLDSLNAIQSGVDEWIKGGIIGGMSDEDLAVACVISLRDEDLSEALVYCENEICGRLTLPLDQTEQGLTPWASEQVAAFLLLNAGGIA